MPRNNPLESENILKTYDLRVTTCRLKLLELLLSKNYAVSHSTIEQELTDFDRVTLYRTLYTFSEVELVHKITDETGTIFYALNSQKLSQSKDNNTEHVHFKCEACNITKCVSEVKIPEVQLPNGYSIRKTHFLINGLCSDCNSKN